MSDENIPPIAGGDHQQIRRSEEQLREGGESVLPERGGTAAEAAHAADARQRAENLGRRIEGRAAKEVRSDIARSVISRRSAEEVGLVEVEATPVVIVDEPRSEQLTEEAERRAERQVSFWFILSALATVAFLAVYIIIPIHDSSWGRNPNVLLGLSLALSMFGAGAGLVLWHKKIMPHEESVQEREELLPPKAEREAMEAVWQLGTEESGFTRRKLLRRSLIASTGLMALPPLFLLRDLGPSATGGTGKSLLTYTRWAPDLRFVTLDTGDPVKIGDLDIGSLVTVVPEGHADAVADSAVMLIRMRPEEIHPGAFGKQFSEMVVEGHIAFSKICTHAGCPVSLYQRQYHTFMCPCHMSTFDASLAGKVIFGPAARALPTLPFYVDSDGYFRAKRDFLEPIGPSFWERT